MKCKLLRERAELDHDYHCVCDQATTDDDDDDDDGRGAVLGLCDRSLTTLGVS